MAANAARKASQPVIRSMSPSPRFNGNFSAQSPPSRSTSFASGTGTTSAFTSPSSFQRNASPTRINRYNNTTPSLSFSLNRPGSPNRSILFSSRPEKPLADSIPQRRTCMCSPTNHRGSFRCSLHKGTADNSRRALSGSQTATYRSSGQLILRRSAMKNSLVGIGTVEADLMKRALAALIRPSSHQKRRCGEFRPRPSRLSAMSKE